MKNLTSRIEKKIYILKYGDKEFSPLTDELFLEVYEICDGECDFPLKRVNGKIFIDAFQPDIFKVLTMLAESYDIVLNHKKLY